MKPVSNISSEKVHQATGHTWDEWVSILDTAGASRWSHKEIVAFLKRQYDLTSWWQQSVTVAYEKAKGRRLLGQTADAGFQVGIQKMLPISLSDAWALLSSRQGIACWLGKTKRFSLTQGTHFVSDAGIQGEVRIVKPNDRVRLTWRAADMKRPATLQIALVESGLSKTSLRVHMEHLPSQQSRDEMKTHWRGVLEQLAAMAASGTKSR